MSRQTARQDPVHLVVDSPGLKVFGEGEWLENKHKIKVKRKRWRTLHLGLDLGSGEIICSELTTDDVDDPTLLRRPPCRRRCRLPCKRADTPKSLRLKGLLVVGFKLFRCYSKIQECEASTLLKNLCPIYDFSDYTISVFTIILPNEL
ncbi:transposase [Agrobacterium vitis]|uniref:transposase n=1 Tax=Agrobacterium vitis TaxID=373 RepID=UPI002DD4226B|nr:transposase [Agrobacterium vitis]